MSRLPRIMPPTEVDVLVIPAIGVCGGVVHGNPPNDVPGAATLGTFPTVGVGLLMMTCDVFCCCDDGATLDDAEFDLVGLEG